jgi:hypothetical protein
MDEDAQDVEPAARAETRDSDEETMALSGRKKSTRLVISDEEDD